MLHWHGDTFDLPTGAVQLASTPVCRNQAFGIGTHALGLQFHAETAGAALESWFVGHACEIAATPGVDVASLRAAAALHSEGLAVRGTACFGSWLAQQGL